MRRETLTDDVIAALGAETKPYRVFDLVDRGLCVVVHPQWGINSADWGIAWAFSWFWIHQAIRPLGGYTKNGSRCGSRYRWGVGRLGDVASDAVGKEYQLGNGDCDGG